MKRLPVRDIEGRGWWQRDISSLRRLCAYNVVNGDVLRVLRGYADNTFSACLTDPPYGISFMGKKWDHGVPSIRVWREVLRVLKPGAFMLAFGGTRTYHRLVCAIEDAGFEIRDCLMWLYGSGFPKSMDVSKALDRKAGVERRFVGAKPDAAKRSYKGPRNSGWERPWMSDPNFINQNRMQSVPATAIAELFDGYGTALKPAWEPIILAMKPCQGTFAENILSHDVGGLNINASRIGSVKEVPASVSRHKGVRCNGVYGVESGLESGHNPNIGRWPANLLLDHYSGIALDKQVGNRPGCKSPSSVKSVSKFRPGQGTYQGQGPIYGDTGGASRFFYTAKASKRDRGPGNTHPTVKPVRLGEYLAKLLLPPGINHELLIPFCGSGSEIVGARLAGWSCVTAIDSELEYCTIAQQRILR